MPHFFDVACGQEAGEFVNNCLSSLLFKAAKALLNRLGFWLDVEAMLGNLALPAGHVGGFHTKNIDILT